MSGGYMVAMGAIVLSTFAVLINITFIPMLMNKVDLMKMQVISGADSFRKTTDAASTELHLIHINRYKRQSGWAVPIHGPTCFQPGAPGPPGPPGVDGTPGTDGSPGDMGVDGSLYDPLTNCIICPSGPRGSGGPRGASGSPGEKGTSGRDGRPGIDGWGGGPGPHGYKGDEGKLGDTGLQGSPGRPAPGGQGEPGPHGAQGPIGRAGSQGEIGLNELRPGLQGRHGFDGLPGKSGTPGFNGSVGDVGEPGIKGGRAWYCPCPKELRQIGSFDQWKNPLQTLQDKEPSAPGPPSFAPPGSA